MGKNKNRKPLPTRIRAEDVEAAQQDIKTIAIDLLDSIRETRRQVRADRTRSERSDQEYDYLEKRTRAAALLLDGYMIEPPPADRKKGGNGHGN